MSVDPHYYSAPDSDFVPAQTRQKRGAALLGFSMTHAQLLLGNLLEARGRDGVPLYFNPVVEMPRRVGKTEGIFSTLVGRCVAEPGYRATYCAQSGQKSRERFYGVKTRLDATNRGRSGWIDRASRGEEKFEFANGSVLRFMPPKAENFRGDADDTIVFDEAQEVDPEDAADLVGSVLPLFDTRPAGQIIIAGTAGEARGGLLWEALEQGRAGGRGILEYSAEDDYELMEELFSKDQERLGDEAISVLLAAHPGIGTLTTLDKILRNWQEMGVEQFLREYLGVWPPTAAAVGLDPVVWASRERDFKAELPRGVALAFDVAPDRSTSSVVASWKDEAGIVRVEVIEARAGVSWLADELHRLALAYKATIHYDTQGGALDIAAALAVMSPKVQTKGFSTAQYASACAAFVSRVIDGRMAHHGQPDLTNAVVSASRRRIGDGLWGWGRRASGTSIAPLVAATMATFAVEGLPVKRERHIMSAR